MRHFKALHCPNCKQWTMQRQVRDRSLRCTGCGLTRPYPEPGRLVPVNHALACPSCAFTQYIERVTLRGVRYAICTRCQVLIGIDDVPAPFRRAFPTW